MKTIAGGKAAGIARWAWQDPAGRVQQAISEVDDLARHAAGPVELAEIQDAGQMLSRLAGTLQPSHAGLAAETITGQLLDLAGGWRDAWRHEQRGPHGEWIGSSSSSIDPTGRALAMRNARNQRLATERKQRLEAAQEALSRQQAQASTPAPPATQPGNKAATISDQIKAQISKYDPVHGYDPTVPTVAPPTVSPAEGPKWEREHEAFFQQRVAPHVQAKAQEVLTQATQKAQAITAEAQAKADEEGEAKEKHSAMLKLAVEGGVAIGGGILAYIEARLGVPDLIAIASSVGPLLIQIIVEFYKRL